MYAEEVCAELCADDQGCQFAISKSGSTIGLWVEGKYVPYLSVGLDGRWYQAPKVLVNGEPLVRDEEWAPFESSS